MRLLGCLVIAVLALVPSAFAQAPGGAQMPPTSAEQGWANCTIQLGRLNDTTMADRAMIGSLQKQLADQKTWWENWWKETYKPAADKPQK